MLKTFIGWVLNYGSCPLCGKTWWLREMSHRVILESENHKQVICIDCDVRWRGWEGTIRLNRFPGETFKVRSRHEVVTTR